MCAVLRRHASITTSTLDEDGDYSSSANQRNICSLDSSWLPARVAQLHHTELWSFLFAAAVFEEPPSEEKHPPNFVADRRRSSLSPELDMNMWPEVPTHQPAAAAEAPIDS